MAKEKLQHDDFALLCSWRMDEAAGQYVVANHSVISGDVPVREGFQRGEAGASGFLQDKLSTRRTTAAR